MWPTHHLEWFGIENWCRNLSAFAMLNCCSQLSPTDIEQLNRHRAIHALFKKCSCPTVRYFVRPTHWTYCSVFLQINCTWNTVIMEPASTCTVQPLPPFPSSTSFLYVPEQTQHSFSLTSIVTVFLFFDVEGSVLVIHFRPVTVWVALSAVFLAGLGEKPWH